MLPKPLGLLCLFQYLREGRATGLLAKHYASIKAAPALLSSSLVPLLKGLVTLRAALDFQAATYQQSAL